ncbi:mCG13775, isoform CRA_a, partial [Mus musculus]
SQSDRPCSRPSSTSMGKCLASGPQDGLPAPPPKGLPLLASPELLHGAPKSRKALISLVLDQKLTKMSLLPAPTMVPC